MVRFLSPEWFRSAGASDGAPAFQPAVVLEQVVTDTPDGPVTYRVEVGDGQTRINWPVPSDAPAADLRITSGWETAGAVARGELSTQRALMQGRLRVSGRPGELADIAASLQACDPVPAELRAQTTY